MQESGIGEAEINLAKKLIEGVGVAPTPRLQKVIDGLAQYNLKGQVEFDAKIARGLDYYTGTVFETVLPDKLEFGSICSGGRYDGLLSQFSDQRLPSVGASIGIDRLYDALEEMNLLLKAKVADVLILNLDENLQSEYIKLATNLRENNLNVELYFEPVKLDKQFKYAEKKGIKWAVVLGEEELKAKTVKLKNISSRDQSEVVISELASKIE
jgi:histidyl-tRNA synthetase